MCKHDVIRETGSTYRITTPPKADRVAAVAIDNICIIEAIADNRLRPRFGVALWWASFSIRLFHVASFWPLCRNTTSSKKPKLRKYRPTYMVQTIFPWCCNICHWGARNIKMFICTYPFFADVALNGFLPLLHDLATYVANIFAAHKRRDVHCRPFAR